MTAAFGPRLDDTNNLAAALNLIRIAEPQATAAHFVTSDQGLYGFTLTAVTLADGTDKDALPEDLFDRVFELVQDISWNGVMRENSRGYAEVALRN